jgi:hypothetical protein
MPRSPIKSTRSPRASSLLLLSSLLATLSCHPHNTPPHTPVPATFFTATLADTRFHVADHMLASIEMQISGEPFAQLLGRNLTGYNRFSKTTDLYTDPSTGYAVVDTLGYATGVETYEYSKQPMNQLSFEAGAGLSLQFGPLLNPSNVKGNAAFVLLRDRLQHFADQSHSGGPPMTSFVVSPAPTMNPLNVYGWPGIWPVFAEFQSFSPDIEPSTGATRGCTLNGGYVAASLGQQVVGDYECGYNSLNLVLREAQVTKVLDPAALGFALWKQGLWVINYWQSVHDLAGNNIVSVADADLPLVGVPGNKVVGLYLDPTDPAGVRKIPGVAGTYLGDIPLEGFQGLLMLDEMHNKAALMLTRLMTRDGGQLGGFASTKEAIAYGYASPLQWWPTEVAVDEQGDPPPSGNAWKLFPQPVAYTIKTAASRLRGLTALAGGFAELFALTDFHNPDVGGQPSSRATFDGDPLPADNQLPDGEETPHDRALAMVKVAVIDIDRLHYDPKARVLVDEATVAGGAVQRKSVVSTVDAAYAIVGLRTALRSLSSTLTLYSNDTPDAQGLPTALDGAQLDGLDGPLAARIVKLIVAQGDFLAGKLVDANGVVANSYDLAADAPDGKPTLLESEAAAIRGLLDAYLATSNERYRQVAMRVYQDLEARFWMSDVRAYRSVVGESAKLTFTPTNYGALTGALRQYWKLVASRPGRDREAAELLERWKRMFKLVVNGWDDANGDDLVNYPVECTGAGLQMAERALTGELSLPTDGKDRDQDCVIEISAAKLPASLGAQLVLMRK